jgi:hypothetical protein
VNVRSDGFPAVGSYIHRLWLGLHGPRVVPEVLAVLKVLAVLEVLAVLAVLTGPAGAGGAAAGGRISRRRGGLARRLRAPGRAPGPSR